MQRRQLPGSFNSKTQTKLLNYINYFPFFQDPRSSSLQFSQGSLPRNTRMSVPPDVSSLDLSSYYPQPIISRISIPPTSTQSRQHRPIPLSVIMRLQNPYWGAISTHPAARIVGGEGDKAPYQPPVPVPREFVPQPPPKPQQQPPELRQPAVYSDGKTPLISAHTLSLSSSFFNWFNVACCPSLQCSTQGI